MAKLPRLQQRLPIVGPGGAPTDAFHRYFNMEFAQGIDSAINGLAEQLALILQAQADITAQQAEIIGVQQDILQQQLLILDILSGAEAFSALNLNGSTVTTLGTAAGLNVGTTAGTVAAGDDARIVGAAQKAGAVITGEFDFSGVGAMPRLGTYGAQADTPTSGFITVKDETGTNRKLAVIA